jgi:hypothetical protein
MRASLREHAARERRSERRALAFLAVTGLLLVVVTGSWAAPASVPAAAAKTAPAKAPSPAVVSKAPVVKPAARPVAIRPSTTSRSAVVAAPVSASPSAVVPARVAGKTVTVQSAPPIDERVTYQYNALGRRDPFQQMVGGVFVGDDVGGDAPPDVGGIKVVGIVWGASDKFALVEDARGNSSVLRVGDKVMNGVVDALNRDAVVVKLTVDGQTETVAIPLTRKGDQTNGNR